MSYQKYIFLAFFSIATLLSLDIFFDIKEGTSFWHVAVEFAAFIIASVPCFYILSSFFSKFEKEQKGLIKDIERLQTEKESWKSQAETSLNGLSAAIDGQFVKWGFTEAEKEIGLLILKGFSHKEIANFRGTSEKTVRQQAAAIYSKSGIGGKSQLSAFFLEDLKLF